MSVCKPLGGFDAVSGNSSHRGIAPRDAFQPLAGIIRRDVDATRRKSVMPITAAGLTLDQHHANRSNRFPTAVEHRVGRPPRCSSACCRQTDHRRPLPGDRGSGRGSLGASCGCRTQRFARALNDLLPNVLWHEPEPRSGESVIMRIAWLTGCNLEWTQHWRVASRPEVPAADLLIVRNRLSCKKFQPTERIVLAARRHCARRRATRRKLGCV